MTELPIAFAAGFFGGFGHCSGMCGPIVAAFSAGRGRALILQQALYNSGRVMTYTLLGALVGSAGSFVGVASRLEGAQYALLAITGILMISAGISVAAEAGGLVGLIERHNAPVLRIASRITDTRSDIKFLPLGLVLGFLPCGLSYTILIGAAGSGSMALGAGVMLGFGLGTVPAMFLIGALAGKLGHLMRGTMYRIGGALVALMGALYLYRAWVYYARL